MPPQIATVVCLLGILTLFMFGRDPEARTSKALWIPVLWLLISGSRPVSLWLAIAGFGNAVSLASPEQYLDGSPVDRLVFAILLAAGLIVLIGRRRQVGAFLRANGPILLFFSYCALSTFWSDYTFVAFKRWTKAVGDLVMVWVVLTDPDRASAVKRLLAWPAFLLLPLSILFIKYYPALGRAYNPWTGAPSYGGVTMNKNMLGMICLIFGLGSLSRFLVHYRDSEGAHRTRWLLAHGTVLAMVVWLLHLADSMTSLSIFIMTGGLMAITSLVRLARKPLVVHLLVAAVVLVSLAALTLDVGAGALGMIGRDATLTGRTTIWNIVLGLAGNPFVGTGFESFWLGGRLQSIWDSYGLHILEAHNGYLDVYLNLGWIGVILLAFLIATGYRNVVRAFRQDPGTGGVRLAFFVTGIVYNFTESGFSTMFPVWILFLLAITAVPKSYRFAKSRSTDAEASLQLEGLETTPHSSTAELSRAAISTTF
jgi:exopolysaccharide production protein ExoQ